MMEVYAGAPPMRTIRIGRVIDEGRAVRSTRQHAHHFHHGRQRREPRGTLQGTTDEIGVNQGVERRDIPFLVFDDGRGWSDPKVYNHYPVGWALAMDTPMQWTKQVASHFGGTRNGLVISLASRYQGQGRLAFSVLSRHRHRPRRSTRQPESRPPDGAQRREAEAHRRHEPGLHVRSSPTLAERTIPVQYFELVGNREILTRTDGWPARLRFTCRGDDRAEVRSRTISSGSYTTSTTISARRHNLADKYPEKLKELQAAFDVEAKKYNVYPIDSSFTARFDTAIRPSLTHSRSKVRLLPRHDPHPRRLRAGFQEQIVDRSGGSDHSRCRHKQHARDDRRKLWWMGTLASTTANRTSPTPYPIRSSTSSLLLRRAALAPGNHVVRVKFQYAGGGLGKGGTAILLADEKEVKKVDVPETLTQGFQQKLREAIGKVMMGGH